MSTRLGGAIRGARGPRPIEFAALGGAALLLAFVYVASRGLVAEGLFGLGLAAALGMLFLRHTSTALFLWMGAAMARASTPHPPGARELYELAFLALIAVYVSEVILGRRSFPRFGGIELFMALYFAWVVGSAIAPHQYPALDPFTQTPWSAYFFTMNSAVMPFATFVIARNTIGTPEAARKLLWLTTGVGVYLSLTNIFEEVGLTALVFPPSVATDPTWEGRAAGIFNQPVINGLMICSGLIATVLLASRWNPSTASRVTALFALLPMGPGIFLTHTRAPMLAAVLILLVGVVFAHGSRTIYGAAIAVVAVMVTLNWSTITSSDRSAGGVGQVSEVESRLNGIATSLEAIRDEPWFGFGLGRFQQVSVHRHEAWGTTTWYHGYGEISHWTELGIGVELGLIGLGLWLAVVVAVGVVARRAWKALPTNDVTGRPFVLAFAMASMAWLINGFTIELRLFAFANAFIFLWAGIVAGLYDRARPDAARLTRGRSLGVGASFRQRRAAAPGRSVPRPDRA